MNPEILQAAAAERAAELRREADVERLLRSVRRGGAGSKQAGSGRQRLLSTGTAAPHATEA